MSRYSFDNQNSNVENVLSGKGKAKIRHMIKNGAGTNCNFIVMVILPAGISIGLRRHEKEEEEIYIIFLKQVSGQGEVQEGDKSFAVGERDVIINPPGEKHGLKNTGDTPLKLVAIDIPAR